MENNNQNLKTANVDYGKTSTQFLTWAIVNLICAMLPVGSIICMNNAKKVRNELLAYLDEGNPHTIKIKISSALLRAARYVGVSFTFIYIAAILLSILYLAIIVLAGGSLIYYLTQYESGILFLFG